MKDSTYSIMCAVLLGVGQMCMFMGYDSQSFVMESVLRSIHDDDPERIDAHAGYNGQAVICLTYTLSNLIAPWILGIIGSKMTLVIGSSAFTLFLCSYFYVHYVPFYLSTAILGFGFALYYTGNGAYLTEHSSRATIERNSALTWAIGTCCMIVGGIVMLFTIRPPPKMAVDMLMHENETFSETSYREYSTGEIRMMYGAFAVVSLLSNIIFALIPSRLVEDSLADTGTMGYPRIGFFEQLRSIFSALGQSNMLKLAPVFCLVGTTTCFWIAVYPTTLIFTKSMAGYIYLPAYYSIVLGSGDMLMGFVISALSKRIPNFGQFPTQVLGVVLYMTGLTLALLSTPPWSTNTPNDESAPLLEPSMWLALFISLLFGLADNCINTSRTILCALVMPGKTAQVFSISKFYQSLIFGIMLFLASYMSMTMYYIWIGLNSILSLVCYYYVAKSTRHMERKITIATKAATMDAVLPVPYRKILGTQPKV